LAELTSPGFVSRSAAFAAVSYFTSAYVMQLLPIQAAAGLVITGLVSTERTSLGLAMGNGTAAKQNCAQPPPGNRAALVRKPAMVCSGPCYLQRSIMQKVGACCSLNVTLICGCLLLQMLHTVASDITGLPLDFTAPVTQLLHTLT
jgi:hypothetical protein